MPTALELLDLTASDLAALIRRRMVSPVEVLDATIERIDRVNPTINAVVFTDYEGARAAARDAEARVMRGERLGPLHGVPVVIKDLFDLKPGWTSTYGGIRAFKDHVADHYTVLIERLEAAGAVLVGRTNSPVFGFRGTTDNPLFGPTRNPFDPSKNAGGSSGGSAAAVAAGMVTLAGGSDGGGSIRIPASWCGVYGYKASFGRIPNAVRPNMLGHTAPFIFTGPLTRTVDDAALALTALAGYDPRDPLALDDKIDFRSATQRPIAGMRIAYTRDYGIFPVDPQVTAVVDEAVRVFEQAGAHVEEVEFDLPYSQAALSDLWCRMVIPLNQSALDAFKAAGTNILADHPGDLPPELHHWLAIGRALDGDRLHRDQAMRSAVYDAFQAIFGSYDLLVSPTLACLPVDNATDGNTVGPREINGEAIDPLIGWCMTYLVNFTGHPAASVPAGLSEGNLPVGMQIVGRRYADVDVLAASAAFERLRPWSGSYAKHCRLP